MRIIAGPCQHESLDQSTEIAHECKRVCDKYGIDYYFKIYDDTNITLKEKENFKKEFIDLLKIFSILYI